MQALLEGAEFSEALSEAMVKSSRQRNRLFRFINEDWLKPLLIQTICCSSGGRLFFSFLHLCKTVHAPQRIFFSASPRWLASGDSRTETKESQWWPLQSRLPPQSPGTPPTPPARGRWRSGDPPNRRGEQNSVTVLGVLWPRWGQKMVLSKLVSKQRCIVPETRPKLPSRAPCPRGDIRCCTSQSFERRQPLPLWRIVQDPKSMLCGQHQHQSCSDPATSGQCQQFIDSETHRRSGQLSRSGVGTSAGDSGRFALFCNKKSKRVF